MLEELAEFPLAPDAVLEAQLADRRHRIRKRGDALLLLRGEVAGPFANLVQRPLRPGTLALLGPGFQTMLARELAIVIIPLLLKCFELLRPYRGKHCRRIRSGAPDHHAIA